MKQSLFSFSTMVIVASLAFSPGVFADIIDQDAPTNNVNMANFIQLDLAQSFQQTSSSISGAGIFLQSGIGTTDNVNISLWDALPNAGGNLLASGSAQGTQGSYVDVFWASVAIIPDTTYYLVFDGNVSLGIAGDISNQYSRGHVFANPGFDAFTGFDYTFRTWTTGVPEPGSAMLLGLATIGIVVRRRRG